LRSYFRVNRAGLLLDTTVGLLFDVEFLGMRVHNIGFHLAGEVLDGHFHARFRVFSIRDELVNFLTVWGHGFVPATPPPSWLAQTLTKPPYFSHTLEPVPVARTGSILNPLHPVNRIKGLRPGQTWRMPLLDPLDKARGGWEKLLGKNDTTFLNARVLPQPQLLPDSPRPIPCLVIEYDDEDIKPRTWVQLQSGLVLRQEATQFGKRLVLQRDLITPEP
jgi:hypothetical protein